MNRGFTVIEVLVTLVVIAVLLGLGTVGVRATLANGRDAERKSDIEAIARGLEQRYNRGSSYSWSGGSATHMRGTYPGNDEMWDLLWHRRAQYGDIMPGVSVAAATSPGKNQLNSICFFANLPPNPPRCDNVETPSNIQDYFSNGSGGWNDKYLYEFIGANNTYCVEDCVRYNLYWISETAATNVPSMNIPGLQQVRSKHQ